MNADVPANVQTVPLVAEQRLVIQESPRGNLLVLLGPDGRKRFSLEVTPDGPVLCFEEGGLTIRTAGELAIDAGRIALHGREGVAITTDGDATIQVAGDLTTTARIQNITAELGNVNVKANDDVKLNGERVMVNC